MMRSGNKTQPLPTINSFIKCGEKAYRQVENDTANGNQSLIS